MNNLNVIPGKIKGYALVRDRFGMPKLDNFNDVLPKEIWDFLTDTDKQFIKEKRDGINTHISN